MSMDDDNTEPVIELGLSLDYSNQCVHRRLNDNSGTGANAAPRVDMTFVTSDPLSELVWSPHKGLSLKCADCSLNERRPCVLWGAEPSVSVLSPPRSITAARNGIDKPTKEENLITSLDALHVKSDVGETAKLAMSTRNNDARVMPVCTSSHGLNEGNGGDMKEMNTEVEASVLNISGTGDHTDNKRKGKCLQIDIQVAATPDNRKNCISCSLGIEPMSGDFNKVVSSDPTVGGRRAGSGNPKLGTEVVLASMEQCRASMLNPTSTGGKDQGLALFAEEESKSMTKIRASTRQPLEKLELTDEFDLQALMGRNACVSASKNSGSESVHEVKKSSQQDKDTFSIDKDIRVSHSPTNSRVRMSRRKGKEKAFSDGDVNAKMSDDGDDSHESVESCNSAGLFSAGKKRLCFEQQLKIGSKRVKKQIEESPGSTSFVRQNSSFVNWISNMMKAFPKSEHDETPSLALTLAHSNDGHASDGQKLIAYKKNQDPGHSNMGFQNIFQSLYCRKRRARAETPTLNAEYQMDEGSNELELETKVCDVNITPIGCHGESNIFCNQSTSGNGAGVSARPTPKLLLANFASSQEKAVDSRENNVSCNLVMERAEVNLSSSSLGKRKANSPENNDFDPPSAANAHHDFNNRSDPMGNLWITRFCPKISSPISKFDPSNQSTGGALVPHSLNRLSTSKERNSEAEDKSGENPQNVMNEELQNCAANTEYSFGLEGNTGHNNQKHICKLNPVQSSQRFKSSDAMASIFARKLDALKHIIPSDAAGNADRATTTCFFCGMRGHSLHDCSKVTKSELEDLISNINSYDGAEESLCFCIRCFQLNHWAVACPSVSSSRRKQPEYGVSMVNHCNIGKKTLDKGNERNLNLLGNRQSRTEVSAAGTFGSEKMPTSDKLGAISIPSKKKFLVSDVEENESKENHLMPLHRFCNQQISDVPRGIFSVIKRLRLSRTHILKWVNSRIPLSYLDGFFLRVRLGKWEEGLGGKGYYVACINGALREKSPKDSKNTISVNIGGVKCLVESQYISNHDFLEDELTAWWSLILRSGGKIPSEGDLRLKLEERKKLGM